MLMPFCYQVVVLLGEQPVELLMAALLLLLFYAFDFLLTNRLVFLVQATHSFGQLLLQTTYFLPHCTNCFVFVDDFLLLLPHAFL